jgi:hypothetical protein
MRDFAQQPIILADKDRHFVRNMVFDGAASIRQVVGVFGIHDENADGLRQAFQPALKIGRRQQRVAGGGLLPRDVDRATWVELPQTLNEGGTASVVIVGLMPEPAVSEIS